MTEVADLLKRRDELIAGFELHKVRPNRVALCERATARLKAAGGLNALRIEVPRAERDMDFLESEAKLLTKVYEDKLGVELDEMPPVKAEPAHISRPGSDPVVLLSDPTDEGDVE